MKPFRAKHMLCWGHGRKKSKKMGPMIYTINIRDIKPNMWEWWGLVEWVLRMRTIVIWIDRVTFPDLFHVVVPFLSETWKIVITQNSENYLLNLSTTSHIFNKYIKLNYNFVLGRHLLSQNIVKTFFAGTDAIVGCFKQNFFNIHIRLISVQIHVQMLGWKTK